MKDQNPVDNISFFTQIKQSKTIPSIKTSDYINSSPVKNIIHKIDNNINDNDNNGYYYFNGPKDDEVDECATLQIKKDERENNENIFSFQRSISDRNIGDSCFDVFRNTSSVLSSPSTTLNFTNYNSNYSCKYNVKKKHVSLLFFYFILFYSILFYSILFYSTLFYSILLYSTLLY
jgi:hypothetical protein